MKLENVLFSAFNSTTHDNTLAGKIDMDFHSRNDGILVTISKPKSRAQITYRLRSHEVAKIAGYFDQWLLQHSLPPEGGTI